MDGFTEKKWFVYLGDHHEGPFSLAELQSKMSQSEITSANYVWAEGMTDWKAMTEVPQFETLVGGSASQASTAQAENFAKTGTDPEPALQAAPLVAIESTPVREEKTGDLSPADLERAQQAARGGLEGANDTGAITTIGALGSTGMHMHGGTPEKIPTAKKKGNPVRLIKWALVILIPAGLVGAYVSGSLDPVLGSPAVKATVQTIRDTTQPYLLQLAEKFPALGKWVSPIPAIEDVSAEDYESLKQAAAQKPEAGPKIAIALSNADLFTPAFYVSSNLPDGALIDVHVQGISETLLNHLVFQGVVQATIQKKLGKTAMLKFEGGKPMPRGEYVIYATESPQQPANVQAILAPVPPVTAKVAPFLPRELKLLVSRSVFLGGAKDASYDSRLKDYHDKLRAKATAELAEIKQLAALLEAQISQANATYGKLKSLVKKGKPTPAARQGWNTYNAQWLKLDEQLKQGYAKWNDAALQSDYFYGSLYGMTRVAGEAVASLHQALTAFFEGKADPKSFEIQRGSAVSSTEAAVAALKAKIDQAEKLAPTPNGMPRREGL